MTTTPLTRHGSARLGRRGAVLLAASLLAAPLPAQTDSTWRDHNQATVRARAAGDWRSLRHHLEAINEALGGHPRVTLRLAGVQARLGDTAAALAGLRTYAQMGLTAELEADSGLIPLRDLPAYAELRERIARNGAPVRRADTVLVFPSRDMLAEDVVWDASGRRFLVASIRERRILAVDRAGAVSDFVAGARDGLWAVIGLGIDARLGLLWAATDATPVMLGYDSADAGRGTLTAFDLGTGAARRRIESPRDGRRHFLGDLTVAPTGEVYVSDSEARTVYVARPGVDTLEALLPPGTLENPQGVALTPDGRRLLVADYLCGLGAVDLDTRRLAWLPREAGIATTGIDGLYVAGWSLLGVQNGVVPQRIVRLTVDRAYTRILGWESLEQNPELDEPTHGVVVGDDFYFIANSGDDRARGATVASGPETRPPALLRVRLR